MKSDSDILKKVEGLRDGKFGKFYKKDLIKLAREMGISAKRLYKVMSDLDLEGDIEKHGK